MKKIAQIIKKYRNSISIRTQLKAISLILLLCCILLCTEVNKAINRIVLKNNVDYAAATSLKFESEFKYLIYQMTTLYEFLQYDEAVQNLLELPYPQKTPTLINEVRQMLASYSILNPCIADISFVNEGMHWSSLYSYTDLDEMYQTLDNSPIIKSFGIKYPSFIHSKQLPYLVFGKNKNDPENLSKKRSGSIIISLDLSKSSIKVSENINSMSYFLLLDSNNQCYPFNCSDSVSVEILNSIKPHLEKIDPDNQEDSTYSFETETYYVEATYLSDSQFYLISVVDIDKLDQTLAHTKFLLWETVIIVLLFIFLFTYISLNNLIRPLNNLNRAITQIREENKRSLDHPVTLEGCAEICNISSEFNEMLSTIKELNQTIFQTVSNLYEAELGKQEAEIAYLRSQINPHFLYNTLEMLRGIAIENQVPQIAEVSSAIGKMFRYSINGNPIVPLEEELEITKAYINIQQSRFVGKFDVIYSIPEYLLSQPVIKMLLQPIVENSIFHSLEQKIGNGLLHIGATVNDNMLILTIRDNGIGIQDSVLQELRSILSNSYTGEKKHIGLANTNARIKLQFGVQYGISIDSKVNKGTVVRIYLPYSKESNNL